MNNPYILIVAPTAYPIYGAEGYVNAKLIKTLSESGFKIDLVSRGIGRRVSYPPEKEDNFFFGKVNAKYVLPIETKYNFKTLFLHIFAFLKTGYVYRGMDWAYPAILKCEDLVSKNKYDFIYTFDYPSEVVGLYVAKKYGIRWVSTWNDPYTLKKYPWPYGEGSNAKLPFLRRKLIKDMSRIVYRNIFPSVRLRDYMLTYMTNIKKESCVICPHINLSSLNRVSKKKGNILSILHSGSLGKERNPTSFCEGMALFLRKYSKPAIHISFLGINNLEKTILAPLLEKYDLKDYVEIIPSISYFESLNIISEYDVCMLIEAPCQEGIFLPSKVMDYMQCGKVIWAISPSIGTLNDMYNERCIDYFSDVRNSSSVFQTLCAIYEDYRQKRMGTSRQNYYRFTENVVLETHVRSIACIC